MKITQYSRNLVLYMSLGDGHLTRPPNKTLRLLHCVKQKEYLEWKRNILISNGINCSDIRYVDNNGYGAYTFSTTFQKFIPTYRKMLYKAGKKKFDKKILNRLTPIGIYIWYLDDGCLAKYKDKNGNVRANSLILNTMLTKEENQVIIDYFKEKWGVSFYQCLNHGWYRLVCGTKEARKFIDIIDKYKKCVPCMEYKFDVKPLKG